MPAKAEAAIRWPAPRSALNPRRTTAPPSIYRGPKRSRVSGCVLSPALVVVCPPAHPHGGGRRTSYALTTTLPAVGTAEFHDWATEVCREFAERGVIGVKRQLEALGQLAQHHGVAAVARSVLVDRREHEVARARALLRVVTALEQLTPVTIDTTGCRRLIPPRPSRHESIEAGPPADHHPGEPIAPRRQE
jgi:hypothetical protein